MGLSGDLRWRVRQAERPDSEFSLLPFRQPGTEKPRRRSREALASSVILSVMEMACKNGQEHDSILAIARATTTNDIVMFKGIRQARDAPRRLPNSAEP